MHGPIEEVGAGKQVARAHLVNHKFYREKAIEFDPHPWKMLDPLWNQKLHFIELMEYNEGMSNMLGGSIYWTVEDF